MTFPGPLVSGFHAALDVCLWLGGALSALVAVVLVLAFVVWLLGQWSAR